MCKRGERQGRKPVEGHGILQRRHQPFQHSGWHPALPFSSFVATVSQNAAFPSVPFPPVPSSFAFTSLTWLSSAMPISAYAIIYQFSLQISRQLAIFLGLVYTVLAIIVGMLLTAIIAEAAQICVRSS